MKDEPVTAKTEAIFPDFCGECDRYREPMDSWLDDGEDPITITTSIEALRAAQDKVVETLDRICTNLESQFKNL